MNGHTIGIRGLQDGSDSGQTMASRRQNFEQYLQARLEIGPFMDLRHANNLLFISGGYAYACLSELRPQDRDWKVLKDDRVRIDERDMFCYARLGWIFYPEKYQQRERAAAYLTLSGVAAMAEFFVGHFSALRDEYATKAKIEALEDPIQTTRNEFCKAIPWLMPDGSTDVEVPS